jgi:hypothetical protein
MKELSEETEKRLTEFLGEHPVHGPAVYTTMQGTTSVCAVCKRSTDKWMETDCDLDFTDWRVVGRLIEKLTDAGERGISLALSTFCQWECYTISGDVFGDIRDYQEADTPQLAICLAIDSYLKGQGK